MCGSPAISTSTRRSRSPQGSSPSTTASSITIIARPTSRRRSRSLEMWLVLAALALTSPYRLVLQTPRIAEIQVHGNLVTSDDEIRRLADVQIGAPVDEDTADQIRERLRATKKFERVQVLKRFASITDPSQIVIVIIVDEGPVKITRTNDPDHPYRAVKNRWPRLMYQPILSRDDRYGTTYGARIAVTDVFGK